MQAKISLPYRSFASILFIALVFSTAALRTSSAFKPADQEAFEKKVRPILAEHCYACHSAVLKTPMGGLRLDSHESVLKGGDSGPAFVPGEPDRSLLIRAVSYNDLQLRMPPKGKLSQEEIATLIEWVRTGPAAAGEIPTSQLQLEKKGVDLQQGRQFWCFQPLRIHAPPSVKAKDWPRSPLDYFILAKLEEKGIAPAPQADRVSWLRRVSFDLIGLPPTEKEIREFLSDESPDARQRVVERLLGSPHYGERWARHWLDLVRYAETNGHEFDNDKVDAWRYRDYVIRAFNEDIPYDQFVKEHIAGDLIQDKRISLDGTQWESPVGTTFFWFGEVLNSATDSVKSRADEVDNQIDVMSKTFWGLTVACARCHDHKFDPVPTSDYYALAGIMHSTGIIESIVDSPSRVHEIASLRQQILDINNEITDLLQTPRLRLADRLKEYLLAAAKIFSSEGFEKPQVAQEIAATADLNVPFLKAMAACLAQARKHPEDPFYPFAALADRSDSANARAFPQAITTVRKELTERIRRSSAVQNGSKPPQDIVFEDFERLNYEGWTVAGQAFGNAPQRELPPNQNLRGHHGEGLANSFGGGTDKLVGSLTSETFRMPKLYVHVRMAGSNEKRAGEKSKLRVTIVADGHKSEHLVPEGNHTLHWKTVRMTKEIGRHCYFEIVDRSRTGHLVIDKIVLSDAKEPPALGMDADKEVITLLSQPGIDSLESLAGAYQDSFTSVLRTSRPAQRESLGRAFSLTPIAKQEDLAPLGIGERQSRIASLVERRSLLDGRIPESAFAMIARDETPHNVRIHVRGNHKNLGEEIPRGYLQVIGGDERRPIVRGSGRLELAQWTGSPENPLTARVMVNRIWKHHFGQSLVRSVDNFGKTGEVPTHPELLDFLAWRFIESGWSIKTIHRALVLSSTYAMSSRPGESAVKIDPQNRLLHHMPVRRLEAEAIRDAILAVAGTLDRRPFGPSVPPHISGYQDGRGKPESGPIDGFGRRSIYVQVRRNFITPMFLALDYPLPITTIGNRGISTVPSQALMMMNNEFVATQSLEWARRLVAGDGDARRRVQQMFLSAFGRPAEPSEISDLLLFTDSQRIRYQRLYGTSSQSDPVLQSWADACHVLFNSAEFLYVR